MRMGRFLLKLFMVYAGLLAGVFLAVKYAVYRQGGLVLPYNLLFISFFGIVFAQFYIINVFFLLISKTLRLDLDRGPGRYFIISFVYAVGYGIVVEFVYNRFITNNYIIFAAIPVLVFFVITAAEIVIANLIDRKVKSSDKKLELDPHSNIGLPFNPPQ